MCQNSGIPKLMVFFLISKKTHMQNPYLENAPDVAPNQNQSGLLQSRMEKPKSRVCFQKKQGRFSHTKGQPYFWRSHIIKQLAAMILNQAVFNLLVLSREQGNYHWDLREIRGDGSFRGHSISRSLHLSHQQDKFT